MRAELLGQGMTKRRAFAVSGLQRVGGGVSYHTQRRTLRPAYSSLSPTYTSRVQEAGKSEPSARSRSCAVTDSTGTGWWDRSGAEADDKCAWSPRVASASCSQDEDVQKVFHNLA